MVDEYIVRGAERADAQAVSQLLCEYFREAAEQGDALASSKVRFERADTRAAMIEEAPCAVATVSPEAVVGVAMLSPIHEGPVEGNWGDLIGYELAHIVVAAEYRRRGVGSTLLAEVSAAARRTAAKFIGICAPANHRDFFLSAGFRVHGGHVPDDVGKLEFRLPLPQ